MLRVLMSGYAMVPAWLTQKVIEGKKLSGNGISAYVNLALYGRWNPGTGEYEECRPSMKTLSVDMGVAVNTARTAVQEVQRYGGVIGTERWDEHGNQLPTVYRVIFGLVTEPPAPTPPKSDRGGTPKSDRGVPQNPTGGPLQNPTDNPEPLTQNQQPEKKTLRAKRAESFAAIADAHFEEWYAAYPKKEKRIAARKAYEKALVVLADDSRVISGQMQAVDILLCAAHAYARRRSVEDPRFTPHPASWLNAGQWDDEAPPAFAPQRAGGSTLVERNGMWVTGRNAASLDLLERLKAEEATQTQDIAPYGPYETTGGPW